MFKSNYLNNIQRSKLFENPKLNKITNKKNNFLENEFND